MMARINQDKRSAPRRPANVVQPLFGRLILLDMNLAADPADEYRGYLPPAGPVIGQDLFGGSRPPCCVIASLIRRNFTWVMFASRK